MKNQSRRTFFRKAAIVSAGAVAFPCFNIGQAGASANSKLNVAFIGVGGRGSASLGGCSKENVVALCDVDEGMASRGRERNPKAKYFKDYRVMMDQMAKEIDAVCVAIPDHSHFPAAMAAMQNNKHVYVEKPLAHNVWQVRTLKMAAHYYNIVSQMGNQGHTTNGIRLIREWYESGALGTVTEVLAWFNGPDFKGHYFSKPDAYPPSADPVPEKLDWNLWLGPAAKRSFSNSYHPRHWRGWFDFGNGELGDWACHTLDGPFWALDLGMPNVIEAEECTEAPECFVPDKSLIRFEFPANDKRPAVTLKWHDGGLKPKVRPEWGLDKLSGSGMIMVGDKCSLMTGGRPDNPKLIPNKVWEDFSKNPPAKTIPRIEGGPWAEWIAAIKGDGPLPGSNFDYASDLTEMALLGVMAQRFNARVEYDAKKMMVTNSAKLNAYLNEPARGGWQYGKEVW